MIRHVVAAAAVAVLAASGAWAQDRKAAGKKTPTAQQQRMADCNKDAGDRSMKGDERRKFMASCLKDKQKAQQDRMTRCSADAKGMKGEERKKFMSGCLKG